MQGSAEQSPNAGDWTPLIVFAILFFVFLALYLLSILRHVAGGTYLYRSRHSSPGFFGGGYGGGYAGGGGSSGGGFSGGGGSFGGGGASAGW